MSFIDHYEIMSDLTDKQKTIFINEYSDAKKEPLTAVLLTLFLGGLGAHHFYMDRFKRGILHFLFCWTFIPGIIAFFEIFFISNRVKKFNAQKASEIAMKIKASYS